MSATSACPGCGLELPLSHGPTHPYIGASAACWARADASPDVRRDVRDTWAAHQDTVRGWISRALPADAP